MNQTVLPPKPLFSVLIGLVSSEDRDRIFALLVALRRQQGGHRHEVIIADRGNDHISSQIRSEFPEVRLLRCAADTSLPALRTRALEQARGEYLVVTEDHCVPPADWLDAFYRAFRQAPDKVAAVGGAVENGLTGRAFDRATFLCEYAAYLRPNATGVTTDLPGMNIAYRGAVLRSYDRTVLADGFWETTLHPLLAGRRLALYGSDEITLLHCKRFSLALFVRQRFLYSRYYAARRLAGRPGVLRLAFCAATLALPPLLLSRAVRHLAGKRRLDKSFIPVVPWLLVFYLIWALGEMVGSVAGPGNALAEIE